MSYVELHCHSNFSFLKGASFPEQLVKRAVALGYQALALTDHNGLYGIVRFNQAAKRHGLRPIFGAEVSLADGRNLVLLAKNAAGYANLSQMLSVANLQNRKGAAEIREKTLATHTRGLIALFGGGASGLPADSESEAERVVSYYHRLFDRGDFYLELQHHHLPAHEILCERLARIGRKLHIPLVATNNVHYAAPEDRRLQDVLTCIKHHTTLDEAGRLLYPNAERYLKSTAQMQERFALYSEAVANSAVIAQQCHFALEELSASLPDFPVPCGETPFSYLKKLTYEGAKKRYRGLSEKVITQLGHELRIIKKLKLAGYFLIVWDIARFCAANGILCQGRGSAANSAVCYCLGVTAVDPIKLDLLFERFVSEERREPPDIDIDIANNRREEVIQYVYERYGREHAAMVCEVITYRGRSAVRDVGKALGFRRDEIDRLAKLLDHYSGGEELQERLRETSLNLDDKRVRLLNDLCLQIKRFPRHLGIHVGGMIITRKPLAQIVPIENATMPNRSVIQWDKDDAEDVRLVKIDLLGLGMLSLIDIAFQLVKRHRGVTIDPALLSYDDPQVYDLICRADTVGVFQVESRAQMNALPRHKPRSFYDLVVEVALIRPGPIQGDMVHPYLRRRNGEEAVTYPHPCLEPILKRTLGVPLFQEQGMRVAMAAAGFSPSEADELRRAMGHKRSRERMEEISARLIAGMVKNGISEEAAEKIYHQLAAFADFGFAESHAASFALLVYVSAYLKVYFPQEFYCALLNAQPMGFYSSSSIVYEAQRKGIPVLGVDVSKSQWDCVIEGGNVRLGYRYIKQLGETAKKTLEGERKRGKFVSVRDFVFRTGLNRQALEQLAKVGAFGCFGLSRRQALWEVLSLLNESSDELPLAVDQNSRSLPAMHITETIAADFRGMDISNAPHPMQLLRPMLKKKGIASAADLKRVPNRKVTTLAGMVVIRQRPVTARGFLFLTLEDETGLSNVVVKPHMLKRFRREVVYSNLLLVKGTVEKNQGVVNLIGHFFSPLQVDKTGVQLKSRDFR